MKSRIAKIAFGCACVLGMSAFVGCGAESSGHSTKADNESSDVADLELANGKAVVCDDDMEGVVAITKDDGYRKCVDGEWVKIKRSEALKADEIIGQIEDDDEESSSSSVIPGTDPYSSASTSVDCTSYPLCGESNSSKDGSSSSRKSSLLDDDEDESSSSNAKNDSSSSVIPGTDPESNSGKDYSAETFDDIPACTAKREGSTVLVEDTGKKYVCEDGEWIALQSTAKSSSSKSVSSSSVKSSSSAKSSSSSVIPSDVEESSSSKGGASTLYECDDGTVVVNIENCNLDKSSSSAKSSSSGSVIPDPDPESSSSNSGIPYTTVCPTGKTCTYAPTEYLNPEITYGEFLDTRDYQVYKTVSIGTQTWMAQNLNYAYTGVPFRTGSYTSDSTSWCYNNVADSCAKYGRLYTWAAAIDSVALAKDGYTCGCRKNCDRLTKEALAANPIQGVCPSGWHLPSYAEWETLFTAVGGTSSAGTKLKSTSGWYSDGNGVDSFGFAVLPAGYRYIDGDFRDVGDDAAFWSSTEDDDFYAYGGFYAYGWFFIYNLAYVNDIYDYKYFGTSVRCLRDSN